MHYWGSVYTQIWATEYADR